MAISRGFVLAALLLAACGARAAPADQCAAKKAGESLELKADSTTVHWGYFSDAVEPNLIASSGDEIAVEMITHHAGDDYDKMVKGDPGVEDIYEWTKDGQNVPMRGKSGVGDGVHVLTGPIYVCDAEPGDVLQIDILDLKPRKNPSTGKTYGSNAAANWGYQFRAGFLDGQPREVITIYEATEEGDDVYVQPDYQFRFAGGPTGYMGPTTPCVEANVSLPEAFPGMEMSWDNAERVYSGKEVPCKAGEQTWEGYWYPGLITTHPTGTEDYSIRGKFKAKANIHIGNIGLAPAYDSPVDSVPPLMSGGNMDNRRVMKGNTLYLPVQVAGAYLSMGDAHLAQGDSELDGTGIETSINGRFKLTLHKKEELPKIVQNLTHPLIEQPDSFVVQGYTYADYLSELEEPMSTIYSKSQIDRAMTVAYNQTRDWMMRTFNLTEDQAISFITIACDFGITQVVDGNFGVHSIIPKEPFGYPVTTKSTGAASVPAPAPVPAAASGARGVVAGALTLLAAAAAAGALLA
ncbi:acetamidase [Chlorella sorokiniana]|uniref:Acetamidase n=1 Tax=Chlorella sorokiniana TaxID=3076 RepID=A0A2P6U0U2_CHLSO|nr:acetamidase [Chlorella sorokiniana]|eukprot:PRW59935.1 acetamidase [Chlorella sorokiniana]